MATYPREITEGSFTVRVYRVAKPKPSREHYFQLSYYPGEGAKRKKEAAPDEDTALARAREIAKTMSAGHSTVAVLKPSDAYQFQEAERLLRNAGFAGNKTVLDAVAHYVRIWQPKITSKTVSELVKAYQKSISEKSPLHKRDVRFRLDAFAAEFGKRHIETISTDEVVAYISTRTHKDKPIGTRTRWNWYNLIRTLWNFAAKPNQSYLPIGHLAVPVDNPFGKGDGAHSRMPAADLETLIKALKARHDADQLVPYVYLQAYAGIRTEEAKRLTWEDIKVEGDERVDTARMTIIEVPHGMGKIKSERRPVKVNKTLNAKLEEYKIMRDPVLTGKIVSYGTADAIVRKVAKKEGIKWKHNMLRHTYISHYLRLSGNTHAVAEQCGTSVRMIKSNYLELSTLSEAIKWFKYTPTFSEELEIEHPDVEAAATVKKNMGW